MESFDNLFSTGMINHWISQTIAMALTIFLIPRLWVTNFFGALFILLGISLVNAFLWDANLFFAIPNTLSIMTIQLFLANGVLFWILVKFLPGIESDGFLPAIFAPLVFSIISKLLHAFAYDVNWLSLISVVFAYVNDLKNSFLQ